MDKNPSDKASGIALLVSGMTCGRCATSVTRVLSRVSGVTDAIVDFDRGRATVIGDARAEDLIAAIQAAGYDAQPIGSTTKGGRQ
jgi:copper chaperone CopZ